MNSEKAAPVEPTLHFASLRKRFAAGEKLWPLIEGVLDRIEACGRTGIWTCLLPRDAILARVEALERSVAGGGVLPPLFGVPFAVKDNIDVAGMPTTAACRGFGYIPAESSPVVERLLAAGAVLIGKTNLDQFASGLTGVLSDYDLPGNAFNADYVSGGSSSGSALAVALGLVSFALGTDTAGSGRVPAAFNNLVGMKPTRGLLSTRGVIPACRSLDCVSVLALNVSDAREVTAVASGFDPRDPYSRKSPEAGRRAGAVFKFGVPLPQQIGLEGEAGSAALYSAALERLEALGGKRVEVDIDAFVEAGRLLYDGPWISERYAMLEDFLTRAPEAVNPVTRKVITRGRDISAVAVFRALTKLQELRARADEAWKQVDLLVLPTTDRLPTLADTRVDPPAMSRKLGRFTNFVNLLDMAALALPAGFRPDGLPFGITLHAPAFSDDMLTEIGQRFYPDAAGGVKPVREAAPLTTTAILNESRTMVCVVGAHLQGQPLNWQLTELGGRLVKMCRTAPRYKLYALANTTPPKPGLVRVDESGAGIAVEVWSLPVSAVGAFMPRVAAPLCLGNVELDDGEVVKGFLCEPYGLKGAKDITHFGGWVNYLGGK